MNKNASALTGLFFAASSFTILTISTVKSYMRKQTMVAVLLTVAGVETAIATGSFLASVFGKSEHHTALLQDGGTEKKKILKNTKKSKEGGTDFFLSFFEKGSAQKESTPESEG